MEEYSSTGASSIDLIKRDCDASLRRSLARRDQAVVGSIRPRGAVEQGLAVVAIALIVLGILVGLKIVTGA